MALSPQALIKGLVSRILPSVNLDSINTDTAARQGRYGKDGMMTAHPPSNIPFLALGAWILAIGWFGFNAGSAMASNALAANAFVATHMAAAAGTVSWAGIEWLKRGKASILGACSGAVAGLVCITPASGSCTPRS